MAAANVAAEESGLHLRQVDNLFRELRREGRNAQPLSDAARTALRGTLIAHADGTTAETRVREHLTAAASETTPDGATQYAQRLLVERARERGQRLQARFGEVATRTGYTTEEIAAQFTEAFNSVDISRGTDAPEEYSTTTRARAVAANLPYDRASVVALERINALPVRQARERRINEGDFQRPTSNSHIERFAYDEGRLEVAFTSNPDVLYAYHDVPENVWEHLRTAQRPGRIYSHYIRGNADYMYDSAEAAEADAYRVRCASCGQFRAAVHSCPEREVREEIVASGVPVAQVAEAMAQDRETRIAESDGPVPTREEMAAEFEATAQRWAADAAAAQNTTAGRDELDISDEEYQQDLAYLVNHLEDLRLTDAVAAGDVTAAEAQQLTDFVAAVSQAQAENPELRTELENLYAQLANQDINEGTDPVLNTDPAELAAALDESATAATEAPAAPRARRTRQSAARPAAGSIRPTDNIVVPETGFQVADNQYERPEMFDATAPATYGRFEVQDPEAPVYAGYTSSADNQFNPQRFDPRALVAYETERGALRWNRMILKGGEDPRSTYGARRFTEEDAQAIMNAPDNMRFVMTESGSYSQPYTPVLAYDYNRYQAISGVRSNEDGTETNVLQLTRKYASATNRLEDRSASTNPNNYEADSASWRASMLAEEAEFSRMREAGTLVSIAANASSSRRYVFDANLGQQPAISTGPVSEIRQAFRDNKIVQVPLSVKFGRNNHEGDNYLDDQGYTIKPDSSVEITGNMRVRRAADGSIEVMNTERQLRCNCFDYRRKYYCKHLNYVQRHAGNVFQQMLPDSMGAGRTIVPVETGATRSHRLMSAALRSRADVEVASIDSFGTQEDYVRVNAPTSGRFTNQEYGWNYSRRLQTPTYYRPADPDNPTTAEIESLNEFNQTIRELNMISTVDNMTPLRQAVRRSDVEIPIRAEFSEVGASQVVTGTLRVARNADGEMNQLQVRDRQLQCTCDVYQRNYDCRHVRAMREQAYMFMHTGGRRTSGNPPHAYEDTIARYNQHMRRERQLAEIMREENTDRDGALRIQQERREAEEQRQREYEERRRQERIEYENRRLEAARAEAEERQRVNQETVDASAAYRANMQARWQNIDAGYTANPGEFYEDYKEALRRKRAGEAVVPFRKENVTDGICGTGPGARRFGIELEFDIKQGVDRATALRKIGQELHEAGLTHDRNQVGYHSAGRQGYRKWSFENDCTVDAELVSPIMSDTPEDWEQLEKALEIIKRNGGVASTRTGSHVHVSTGSYESSTAKHLELLRTVNNNDDILYRLASSPSRGRHRGMQWCAPNVNDDQGDIAADVASTHNVLGYAHQSHNVGINFGATYTPQYKQANVEFRMWDGTLDAAMIQQQVVMSAAITDYAERSVMEKGVSVPDRDKRLNVGNGKQREQDALQRAGVTTHTAETFQQANGHVGEFLDKIFRRKEDRQAAAAMFAATSWQDRYR